MPSCLSWKFWSRKHKASKQNSDYIYLQWHFMTSQQDQKRESPVMRSPLSTEESKYADIRTWLDSLPDTLCTEIYCDCCDVQAASTSTSTPSVSSRRQDSISSVTSSHCSCAECLPTSPDDEESLYSLQLRKKSRDIFLS